MVPIIRLADEKDAPRICEIYAPIVRETAISFETEPPGPREMAGRLEKVRSAGQPWLVYENGPVLGYVYATGHRESRAAYHWSVEVSAYVHADARRSGVGRALYTSLFEILKLQGYQNAFAGATLPNAASVRLHESVGFERIGTFESVGYKFGRWHDVVWWALRLGDHPANPEPPVRVEAAAGRPGWDTALMAGAPLLRR